MNKRIDIEVLLKRSLLGVLIIYICYLFVAQQFDLSRLGREEKALAQQVTEQQQIHSELEAEKEAVGTPEYMERVAREKLGYMKPGERVFVDTNKQ
ncbi:MAG: septum formation initiator family protein [Clostridia bacterium]|nr:septum formation initiator family protein [Clostridia bacterium]